jgi:hypothetical protein
MGQLDQTGRTENSGNFPAMLVRHDEKKHHQMMRNEQVLGQRNSPNSE